MYLRRDSSSLFRFKVATREGQERRPIRTGCVTTTVLTEGYVTVNQGRLYRGEFGRAHVAFAEQLIDRPRASSS